MTQLFNTKQQVIYFDYTSGRGNYDDEYQEENLNCDEIKKEQSSCDKIEKNENHCIFDNLSNIKPHYLNQQKLKQISHQRRHSYNKGPQRGRASGRTCQEQQTDYENNFHFANENIKNCEEKAGKISNSLSHQFPEVKTWAPVCIK